MAITSYGRGILISEIIPLAKSRPRRRSTKSNQQKHLSKCINCFYFFCPFNIPYNSYKCDIASTIIQILKFYNYASKQEFLSIKSVVIMNFKKFLKVVLSLFIGGGTGYLVYRGVSSGFNTDNDYGQYGSQVSNDGTPRTPKRKKCITINPVDGTEIEQEVQEQPIVETNGDIICQGLRSAANVCTVASGVAQCVSGIADNINRLSAAFRNNNQQPQYNNYGNFGGYNQGFGQNQNYGGTPYCYPGQPQQYINTSNGCTWNRVNPSIVTTSPIFSVGGPAGNYTI